MDINCDMGEGIGNEATLMPFIDSANIACGYHAGDTATIEQVIMLCQQYQVHVGAHPSYLDRENFGRTAVQVTAKEIYGLITDQLKIIHPIALGRGAVIHHVKPHGALYNMAAIDPLISQAIACAVRDFDDELILYGLSGSVMISEAIKVGLKTANEVFADRTYQNDGKLTARSHPKALHNELIAVKQQVKNFIENRGVTTVTGDEIFMQADTICIHGDGPHAIEFAEAVYQLVHEK